MDFRKRSLPCLEFIFYSFPAITSESPPPPLRLRLHVMTSKADYQGMCSIRRSNLGWNELNYTFVAKYFCKDCWEFNQLLGLIACFKALIFCSVRVLYIFA